MRSRRDNFRRGFTLMEALAVVTVVGIVLPAVMYCISMAENTAALVKQQARASEIANDQLNMALLTGIYQGAGDDTETGAEFHWVTQTQGFDSNLTNLQQLTVNVTWSSGGRSRELTLATLVYTTASAGGMQ